MRGRAPELEFEETDAVWSPDGSTIAYYKDGGIWFVDSDGTNDRFFTEGIQADWSPDGKRLAIATAGWNIFLVDKDSANFEWLIRDGESNSPAWSPDGKWVAFVRPFAFDGLDIINLETLEETVIPDASRGDWSPDGHHLCFAYRFNGIIGIGYADILTQKVKQIALLDEEEHGPITPPPRWSPDGKKILFEMGIATWVIDTSDQNLECLAEWATDPNWSPDGEQIIFTKCDEGGVLCLMDADGSNKRPLR